MKSKEQIIQELQRQFLKRLKLRKDRKLKKSCRNCRLHKEIEIDLGEFGKQIRYSCSEESNVEDIQNCGKFKCIYTPENIEEEMMNDLKDPAICGAKEPKIASLLWVLHDNPNDIENKEENTSISEQRQSRKGMMSWLGQLFK